MAYYLVGYIYISSAFYTVLQQGLDVMRDRMG